MRNIVGELKLVVTLYISTKLNIKLDMAHINAIL